VRLIMRGTCEPCSAPRLLAPKRRSQRIVPIIVRDKTPSLPALVSARSNAFGFKSFTLMARRTLRRNISRGIVTAGADGSIATSYPVGQDDLNTTMELTGSACPPPNRDQNVYRCRTLTQPPSPRPPRRPRSDKPLRLPQTVTGGATPTGNVHVQRWRDRARHRALNSSGVATLTTSSLAAGAHSVTASYPGDTTHAAKRLSRDHADRQRGADDDHRLLVHRRWFIQRPFLRPDHIVVVIEEDRAVNAIGDTAHMPVLQPVGQHGPGLQ